MSRPHQTNKISKLYKGETDSLKSAMLHGVEEELLGDEK